jgi:CheY-like chemotaxis protein
MQQAANGETALKMASEKAYDVIFLDQYMASAEKQLLGTETAHALRAQGVTAIICGLSANQIENSFLKCGANAFIQKPFPCEEEALTNELIRVLEIPQDLSKWD